MSENTLNNGTNLNYFEKEFNYIDPKKGNDLADFFNKARESGVPVVSDTEDSQNLLMVISPTKIILRKHNPEADIPGYGGPIPQREFLIIDSKEAQPILDRAQAAAQKQLNTVNQVLDLLTPKS